MFIYGLIHADPIDPENVKDAISSLKSPVRAEKALSVALDAQRADMLLDGIKNPNWDIKSLAVTAMSKLPRQLARESLLEVLRLNYLWSSKIKGGVGYIAQDGFNVALLTALSQTFMINYPSTDLFDDVQRSALLFRLEAN